MKKLIAITLGIILVVAGLVVPAAAEETVLGMVGRTFTASDQTVLPYRMYAPTGDAPENGFAVYMHFHGVGECGSDNVSQTATGMELVKKIIQDKGQEAIVLVPQCDTGSTWVNVPFVQGIYSTDEVAMSRYLTAAMELLEAVKSQNKIDMDRLYIGGLSMGGYAVWDLLARYPDTFAAAIPVCGGGDPAKAENMKEVAIRTYHSDDDPTVPVAGTRALVEAVQTVGGNIAYKEFTNMGHNCWTRAFNMPDQVNWLFSQSRQPEEQPSVPQEQPSVPQEQPSVPQEPVWEQGDVNEDSQVDAKDALLVLKSAVGKITLTDGQSNRADVNRDEAIDAKDALDILKYAVGKIDSFAPLPGEPVVPPVDQPEVITPTDFPLEDSSTGKVNPRLVTTKYATQEVVVADIIPTEDGYAVNPDGLGDSTAGIQKALNDCASYGGGTVFLPDGTYLVTRTITIPPRVTLRGDWQDPDLGKEGYGTVIHVWMPPEDTNQGGLFLLSGSSGVVGMTVYYPHQSLENVKAYPPVFYTNGRGVNYMLSTVKDCTVINGYRGIGACCDFQNPNAHEQFTVENVKGTFLYTAAEMYNQADVGTWENVVVSNRYWADVKDPNMTSASANQLDEYTRANTVGMKLGDLEWTEFVGLQIENCKIGLEIVNGQRIHFAGSLYGISITGCGIGIQIDDLDDRWGMVIAQSTIQNGIINNTDGLVKLWNVALSGGSKGQITLAKDEEVTLSLPTDRSYVKPNANTTVARLTRNGIMDISAALQEILDKIGETGGVVYLPSGTYRLDAPITVPAGVELRGSNAVATRGFGENNQGTVLLSYYGDGEAFDPMKDAALITLAGENAGLSGIRITYPRNGPYDENLNTTYVVRGTASGVYVVNCCITAAGYGIDFTGCDDHFIKKVTTCCYYNTYRLGGKTD